MQRTQVYLGAEELDLLERASARTGASRSELIRRAIRERYGDRDWASRRTALEQSAGAWADHEQAGAATVEASRGDLNDRLARLGWS